MKVVEFVAGMADAVFRTLTVEKCLPLDPEKPREGGLYHNADTGLYVVYRTKIDENSLCYLIGLETKEEYAELLQHMAAFCRGQNNFRFSK